MYACIELKGFVTSHTQTRGRVHETIRARESVIVKCLRRSRCFSVVVVHSTPTNVLLYGRRRRQPPQWTTAAVAIVTTYHQPDNLKELTSTRRGGP
jgi:hypothetical protein